MKLLKSLKNIKNFDTIYIHPDNYNLLVSNLKVREVKHIGNPIYGTWINTLSGIEIITDDALPKYIKKWKFPVTRFVEYDEVDEVWARPIKFGNEIDTDEPAIYFTTKQYRDIFHPKTNILILC